MGPTVLRAGTVLTTPSRHSQNALPSCHAPRPIALRSFIVADYGPGANGVLIATPPNVGPCHDQDERPCVICLDHFRLRSTGPCFPLAVLRCLTHDLGFTLYPPGYVPYGRVAVAPVALDGGDVDAGVAGFANTVFGAAMDGAQAAAWHRQCPGGTSKWWSTQGRQVAAAVDLCGVAPELDAAARQAQAGALRVDTLLLIEGAQAIAAAPGYRSRGQAVLAVLGRVAVGPCVLERVLAAGHLAGLWGPPWRWDSTAHRLRRWAFRGQGTRPP